ncbi:DNA translocase FtsK [Aromatoleum evansii]|uniref:DNA translocase FtsK n=1 Tax=Aromatoleum evansii TaxID=59406 RepID=A0ABZ1ARA1_AROEV|nr:DNA translocase FtsK [Aromatoleum evansii]WRL48323.1 DNA translocase FtsK [Aromatoleum evansii]
MSAKFRFLGKVQITHLNTRKEGPDEEKELAVDIKCEAIVSHDICSFFEPMLSDLLFLPGGSVRNLMLQPVEFSNELENYRAVIAGSTHYGCKVKKFRLQPKDTYQIRLTFQVSFKPSGDEVARIAEYLQDEMDIELDPANDELDFGAEGAEGEGVLTNLNDRLCDLLGDDSAYEEAKRVVLEQRRPSISLIQRRLRIGYNRAARLLEQMEIDGIVSAMNADGTREVIAA